MSHISSVVFKHVFILTVETFLYLSWSKTWSDIFKTLLQPFILSRSDAELALVNRPRVPSYSCTEIRHLYEQRVAFLFPMFIIKFRVGNAILLNTAGDSLACEALTTLDLLLTVVLNRWTHPIICCWRRRRRSHNIYRSFLHCWHRCFCQIEKNNWRNVVVLTVVPHLASFVSFCFFVYLTTLQQITQNYALFLSLLK